jgi:DNA-binding NtrC family response regulator
MNDLRILIVDDEIGNANYVHRILRDYDTSVHSNSTKALAKFRESTFDIVIADQKMPSMTGIELIQACRDSNDDFLGIIISAYTDSEDLVDAVNSNLIHKYIVKPFAPEVLLQHVMRTAEVLRLRRDKATLERKLHEENRMLSVENEHLKGGRYGCDRLLGNSPIMRRVRDRIRTFAVSASCVLITGDSGTGKELAARAIHEESPRMGKPLILLNCSAISAGIFESELFGHAKGAFTGAEARKEGFFQLADGGTLCLDEIGDMPLDLQPKVLRAIQFGTFYPVGSRTECTVDVRIVAATNRNIENRVAAGEFRDDLYHRLNVLRIHLPPLRERKEDILILLDHLLRKNGRPDFTGTLSPEVEQQLRELPLQGNVRELETIAERIALMVGPGERLTAEVLRDLTGGTVLPDPIDDVERRRQDRDSGGGGPRRGLTVEEASELDVKELFEGRETFDLKAYLEEIERTLVFEAFERHGGNITQTAEYLSLSRQGLKKMLSRYGSKKDGNENDGNRNNGNEKNGNSENQRDSD